MSSITEALFELITLLGLVGDLALKLGDLELHLVAHGLARTKRGFLRCFRVWWGSLWSLRDPLALEQTAEGAEMQKAY